MLSTDLHERPGDATSGAGDERFDTIVIGAGQAGLSVAHHLAREGQSFVVLEGSARVGDVWRRRFDSLRLYSPRRYDGLPGLPFPGDPWSFPGKDDVGDYLESYASHFDLPVRTGVAVDAVERDGAGFAVLTGDRRMTASQVVVATGGWRSPVVPACAADLDPRIRQLHSSDYRNPSQLPDGPVLVVGAAHSGADVALELAATHETVLAGPTRGEVPFDIEGRPARAIIRLLWFVANHVLTMRTPMGRRMRRHVRGEGGPLLRVRNRDLLAAGVDRTEARVCGTRDGAPLLDDGRVLDVASIVWCTGFRNDLGWLRVPLDLGDDGWPAQDRGEVASCPGLWFVGLPFQYAFASMLVGGVGRDARDVSRRIVARAAVA